MVARRNVDPRIVAIFDLDHAVAVTPELIPMRELEARILIGRRHHKRRSVAQPRTGAGRVIAAQNGRRTIGALTRAQPEAVRGRPGGRRTDLPDAVVDAPVVPDQGALEVFLPD